MQFKWAQNRSSFISESVVTVGKYMRCWSKKMPEPWQCNKCLWMVLPLKFLKTCWKHGGQREVWLLCSFYHEPLRTCIETNVNKFTTSNSTVLKLDKQALRNYLKLTCKYELHISPNTKVSATKDHGKTTWRSDHHWSAIFSVIVCCKGFLNWTLYTPLNAFLTRSIHFVLTRI